MNTLLCFSKHFYTVKVSYRAYSTSSKKDSSIKPSPVSPKHADHPLWIDTISDKRFHPPKLPIVFCHGLLGFDKLFFLDYWRGVRNKLEEKGCKVVISRVPPTAGISTRAHYLKITMDHIVDPDKARTPDKKPTDDEFIWENKLEASFRNITWDSSIPVKKVHLIGHSMGGLDSRHYISKLGGHEHVYSLTTVGSPHRGSCIADWLYEEGSPYQRFKLEKLLKLLFLNVDAFKQLTRPFIIDTFNNSTPNHQDVKYFSLAGGANGVRMTSPLYWFHRKMMPIEGPNDGLVSIDSSVWGTFLGTLDADHLEQINWNFFKDTSSIYYHIASLLGKLESQDPSLFPTTKSSNGEV